MKEGRRRTAGESEPSEGFSVRIRDTGIQHWPTITPTVYAVPDRRAKGAEQRTTNVQETLSCVRKH